MNGQIAQTYNTDVARLQKVKRIDFSIQSNTQIIKDSAIRDPNGITVADTHNSEGEPMPGGVIDKRLGITDDTLCWTCGGTKLTCPGHFGHIKLAEPVFHIELLPYLKSILSCICIRCNKLLVYRNERDINKAFKNKQGKFRLQEIKNACKSVTHCQRDNEGCGTPVHKISIEKKVGGIRLVATLVDKSGEDKKKRTPQIITPQLAYSICKNISDDDCIAMGLDPRKVRPEDFIITNMPVPPVQIRPSVRSDPGLNTEDDLTHKLFDIVKSNQNILKIKGDGSLSKSKTNDDHELLQLHVSTFIVNDQNGPPKSILKNKKPTKSLSERLKGKEGRIRNNMMGKRVDMSGRTVITSDPNIPVDYVGVPLFIAQTLTYPEFVTPENIDYMTNLIRRGPNAYPGARNVMTRRLGSDGTYTIKSYILKHSTKQLVKLAPGDIVERNIVNGDAILFNRQPSLHKMSLMGHKTHIVPNPSLMTFRLNVSATDPYNADFDGDEMNGHIPQSIQTVSETRLIADISKRFVSPSSSRVAVNVKQDTLLGSFTSTSQDAFIDWKDAMNLLMVTSVGIHNHIPKNCKVSGKYLISEIIPQGINVIKGKAPNYSLRILDGQLIDGNLVKSDVGSISQKLWFQNGSNDTKNFIDDLQRMMLQYLMRRGFTMGYGDTYSSKEIRDAIFRIIETKRKSVVSAVTEYENDPYIMTPQAFEISSRNELQSVMDDITQTVMSSFKKSNGIYTCIKSAANGTDINAAQIIGCIGQVVVEQARVPKWFNNRSLPTFPQYDPSPFAGGFCYNSFSRGLDPMEFWFQAMAGREGLMNTAIKTASTGYVQRKLIKFTEDICVKYDGTVRNANDKIIQLVYGGNCVNVEKQIEQEIKLINMNNAMVEEKMVYTKEELTRLKSKEFTQKVNDQLRKKLFDMRDKMRLIQSKTRTSRIGFIENYMMPVDLIQKIFDITHRENRKRDDLVDPYDVLLTITDMYSGDRYKIMKYQKSKNLVKERDEKCNLFLTKIYLFDVLCPKRCTHEYFLQGSELQEIADFYYRKLIAAVVEAGEMVGIVCAQSIGEPITQLNLKSFHKSGTGVTVTGGLERVIEILEVTRKPKTPTIEIVLLPEYKNNKIVANKIASQIKFTSLRDVVDLLEIVYDPFPENENSFAKLDGVTEVFKESHGKAGCQPEIARMPWILRLHLSKEKMVERNVDMMDIKTSFCNNWAKRFENIESTKKDMKRVLEKILRCAIASNFNNSDIPMIHIRFDAKGYNFNTLKQFQEIILNTFKIKGFPGIHGSEVELEKYVAFDETGSPVVKEQYIIRAQGNNIRDIAQLNGIDLANTRYNDIVSAYEMYGVETARNIYIKEFVVALSSAGSSTNYQHIELLASGATHMGNLIAVNRHGTNRLDTDPLSKASFEKTVEQLIQAGVFGESDYIRSVSAKIMLGEMINGGTGCFDLMIDHEKLKSTTFEKQTNKKPILKKRTDTITKLINSKRKGSGSPK